jgi:hypothetical protein
VSLDGNGLDDDDVKRIHDELAKNTSFGMSRRTPARTRAPTTERSERSSIPKDIKHSISDHKHYHNNHSIIDTNTTEVDGDYVNNDRYDPRYDDNQQQQQLDDAAELWNGRVSSLMRQIDNERTMRLAAEKAATQAIAQCRRMNDVIHHFTIISLRLSSDLPLSLSIHTIYNTRIAFIHICRMW